MESIAISIRLCDGFWHENLVLSLQPMDRCHCMLRAGCFAHALSRSSLSAVLPQDDRRILFDQRPEIHAAAQSWEYRRGYAGASRAAASCPFAGFSSEAALC